MKSCRLDWLSLNAHIYIIEIHGRSCKIFTWTQMCIRDRCMCLSTIKSTLKTLFQYVLSMNNTLNMHSIVIHGISKHSEQNLKCQNNVNYSWAYSFIHFKKYWVLVGGKTWHCSVINTQHINISELYLNFVDVIICWTNLHVVYFRWTV